MSATVVIDLGEDWAVSDEPPAGRRWRPSSRALLAALVLVAALLLTGASAAPRPAFVVLGTVEAQGTSATEVGDGAVFVGAQTLGRRSVTRYPLGGGAQDWSVTVSGPPEFLLYLPGSRTLMVESFDVEINQGRFTMLDAATGRELWTSSGRLTLDGSDADPGALLVDVDGTGATVATYTDLRTGRGQWSRAVPAYAQLVATDDDTPVAARGYLIAEADGTVSLLARHTGAVLATGQIGRLVPVPPGDFQDQITAVNVVGDRLLVLRQQGPSKATLDSFTLPAMRHEWSRSGELSGFPYTCGPVLCLGEATDLVALDPSTGATRWHLPGWQSAQDLGGGRLLGYRQGNGQQGGILDAGTGRLLLDLGDWVPVQGPGQPELLTKPDRNYRYTWFAALDPARPGVRVLARLAGVGTPGCDPHGDLLVCRTVDARLQVWRYQR